MSEAVPDFPVGLRLQDRRVLVLGGNPETARKVSQLCTAGARVLLVWPDLPEPLRSATLAGSMLWFARLPEESDLAGLSLVVLCERDESLARWLWERRRRRGYLLSALDQPRYCDLHQVASSRHGALQIAYASAGQAPALARLFRQQMEQGLPTDFDDFTREVAQRRQALQQRDGVDCRKGMERLLQGFDLQVRVRYPDWYGRGAEQDES